MPLSRKILDALEQEIQLNSYVRKSASREAAAQNKLTALGISSDLSVFEFFSKYSPTAMLNSIDGKELSDIDDNIDEITELTHWAHDLGLSTDFILITNFEGEYFLAYSKQNDKIYGVNFGEFELANSKELAPKWSNFEALLTEYFGISG